MGEKVTNRKNMLTFVLGSAFGVLMFLVPIPLPLYWSSSRTF